MGKVGVSRREDEKKKQLSRGEEEKKSGKVAGKVGVFGGEEGKKNG